MSAPLRTARSALRLRAGERRQAARALAWMALVRLLLYAFPYSTVRRIVAALPAPRRDRSRMTLDECARALRRASRLMPAASCLPRAIAAECLLRRAGHRATLVLGVACPKAGRLQAHAWVESGGVAVVGGEAAGRFRRLQPARPAP